MSQKRIWDFGTTVTADRAKISQQALNQVGVYTGFDLTVTDVDRIQASPLGYLMVPNGTLITETVAIDFRIPILPSDATTYTITCRHDDQNIIGGVPAVYSIEVGNFTSLTNGTVLGWIYYPGGAIPLDSSFVVNATKVGAGAVVDREITSSSAVTSTDQFIRVATVGSNTVLTLPNPSYKVHFTVLKTSTGTNTISLSPFAGERIQGAAATYLLPGSSAIDFPSWVVWSTGTAWWVA